MVRHNTWPTPDRHVGPCKPSRQLWSLYIYIGLHSWDDALFCCTDCRLHSLPHFPIQRCLQKKTPSVIDRRLHQRSTNASFSTIFRQCATTHKSNSVAAMSATQFEHGVQTTRQPINAAPPVLWRLSLGTLKSIRSIHTPNKKHRLDERCGDCRAPVIHPSWMTRQTKNTRIQT